MGKQSNSDPMRAAASLSCETYGRIARCCISLGLVIFFATSLATSGRAQTQATTLPLMLPSAIVFDAAGNLYFVETGNHVVRKLSSAGIVTTVAGNGVQGFAGDNGPATAAQLDSPAGLALDSAGDLFIADSHNHRIREISSATGTIATIAGTGAPGFSGDGGPAKSAQLDLPTALAFDSAGNLYLADTNNHRVRRIAATTGVIATVAGNGIEAFAGDNGPATAASIDSPTGLALDSSGNLYIADTHNGRLREVAASTGLIFTVAGAGVVAGNVQAFGGDNGPATAAGLALPRGLTMDSAGNLYFADSANHRIRHISPTGTITTVAGQGTENFAGDGAPAVTADLDSPRSVAISPAGLLTLADSANQRIRQLDALPAPGPDIHTIAGLGATTQGVLALSGPSVVAYGSGSITATLNTSSTATGSVTFLDTSGGTQITLGTSNLNSDAATISTSTLAAAAHSVVATYPGDATHPAAQSSALAITVSPLAIAAAPNPASILYGQPIPALSGTLTGVLAQDAGNVAAVFTSSAAALSPTGSYPIAATLTGSAAANYSVATTPAAYLSIAQAPTQTSLSASSSSPGLGLPVTLTVQATSITSGVPTGSIAFADGSATLSVVPLTAGAASFTTGSLALGAHNLSASYSGDANFLPSSSATANVAVGPASDFTLTATGATAQSIPAGSSATYSFSVAMLGAAMSSPIALAVQGVPPGATSSINPSYIPPGGAVTGFTVTIQTPLATLDRKTRPVGPMYRGSLGTGLLAVLLLPMIGLSRRLPHKKRGGRILSRTCRTLIVLIFAAASCILLATLATGCGNRINADNQSINSTNYTLTVTGTATGPAGAALQHSAVVTLQVIQ
jgi:sugar lactone lactonase YvrE